MNKAIETLIKRHRFSPEDKKLLMQIAKSSGDNNGNLDSIQIKYLLNPHIIANGEDVNTDLTDGTNFKSDYLNTGLYRIYDHSTGNILNVQFVGIDEVSSPYAGGAIVATIEDGKYSVQINIPI